MRSLARRQSKLAKKRGANGLFLDEVAQAEKAREASTIEATVNPRRYMHLRSVTRNKMSLGSIHDPPTERDENIWRYWPENVHARPVYHPELGLVTNYYDDALYANDNSYQELNNPNNNAEQTPAVCSQAADESQADDCPSGNTETHQTEIVRADPHYNIGDDSRPSSTKKTVPRKTAAQKINQIIHKMKQRRLMLNAARAANSNLVGNRNLKL